MAETTNAAEAVDALVTLDDLRATLTAMAEENADLRERLASEEEDAELIAAECKRLKTSKALGGGKWLREFRDRHKAAFPSKRRGTPGLIRLAEKLLEANAAGSFEDIGSNNDRVTKLPNYLHPKAAIALLELLEAVLGDVPVSKPGLAVGRVPAAS